MNIRTVAVLGAGIMGHGIAQVCAYPDDIRVICFDPFPEVLEQAKKKIAENLGLVIKTGLVEGIEAQQVIDRITFTDNLADCKEADIVFEAASERFEVKEKLYSELSTLLSPNCIITSNTSSIPIIKLAKLVNNPERVIGAHFFQPAHLLPLVEVIQQELTDLKVVEQTIKFIEKIGKVPAHVQKDVPGGCANRMQYALAREAMSMVQNGIVSAADLDKIVVSSFAPRLVFTGPIEQRDLNGIDTHMAACEHVYAFLENTTEPLPIMRKKMEVGDIGLKTGKGFYDWTGKNPLDVYKKKNEEMIAVLKFLKDCKK